MQLEQTHSQRFFPIAFVIVSAIVFVIEGIRCYTVPFCHDETATFFYYVQSGSFLPFMSHVDANNHVLNSFLSWVCFRLFGDSPFALRLPNLLSLLILIAGTYRISTQLKQTHAKLILLAGFLLSFHWLSFYSACRGYGLSMAFLVLSISYLIEYFNSTERKKLLQFYLFLQIAISAILILVIIAMALTFAVIVFQFLKKHFFKVSNIIVLIIHLALVVFWVKFSFFLQDNNALYLGEGKNYWEVTFVSLTQLLCGYNNWAPFLMLFCFVVLSAFAIAINIRPVKAAILNVFTPSLFYTLLNICFIIGFYALKKILNVNYPEDRTGLFFYVFFILSLAFTLDLLINPTGKAISYLISGVICLHFVLNINFRKHSLDSYITIPERFYTYLLNEQKSNPEPITIGGHRAREFIYDFWNYRHGGKLNPIDAPNEMFMNCDYAIANKEQEKVYAPYYDQVDVDKDWNLTLLKHRQKIKRNLLISVDALKPMEGTDEFYNLYFLKDTAFKNRNPLLIEFNGIRIDAEMPVSSWLVLEIDTANNGNVYYRRIPLSWIRYDWNNTDDQKLLLISGQLPSKIHALKCYLWNTGMNAIKFQVSSIKIYQLEGDGVNVSTPTR